MFQDLRQLWAKEDVPQFVISPGDIIEYDEPEHYQFARQEMDRQLGNIPFYPGLGNHELFHQFDESEPGSLEDFSAFWGKTPHYYWTQGKVLCVMLDVVGYPETQLTEETLVFLETALAKHPRHLSLIFAHCPLYNTVLDRDTARDLDYDSLEPFFYLENSTAIREILAGFDRHCFWFSGHTHAGWQSPHLVHSEASGKHTLTSVNLSSPWYTGKHHGIAWSDDRQTCRYRPDEPDAIVSWQVRVIDSQVRLLLRDHRTGSWLREWVIPVQ
jgi:3',5'-cyclic AMP phosphodiesterase CpdA